MYFENDILLILRSIGRGVGGGINSRNATNMNIQFYLADEEKMRKIILKNYKNSVMYKACTSRLLSHYDLVPNICLTK